VLKVRGAEGSLRGVGAQTEGELAQLKFESEELALLLESILKTGRGEEAGEGAGEENNTPSPKFISIQETVELKCK
jgi:hypothetical protein